MLAQSLVKSLYFSTRPYRIWGQNRGCGSCNGSGLSFGSGSSACGLIEVGQTGQRIEPKIDAGWSIVGSLRIIFNSFTASQTSCCRLVVAHTVQPPINLYALSATWHWGLGWTDWLCPEAQVRLAWFGLSKVEALEIEQFILLSRMGRPIHDHSREGNRKNKLKTTYILKENPAGPFNKELPNGTLSIRSADKSAKQKVYCTQRQTTANYCGISKKSSKYCGHTS